MPALGLLADLLEPYFFILLSEAPACDASFFLPRADFVSHRLPASSRKKEHHTGLWVRAHLL